MERIYREPSLWTDRVIVRDYPLPGRTTLSAIPLFPHEAFTSTNTLKQIYQETLSPINPYRNRPFFDTRGSMVKTTKDSVIGYGSRLSEDMYKLACFFEFNTFGLFLYHKPLARMENNLHYIQVYDIVECLDQLLEIARAFFDNLNFSGLIQLKLTINDIFRSFLVWAPFPPIEHDDVWFAHDNDFETVQEVYKAELTCKRLDIIIGITKEVGFAFNLDITRERLRDHLENHNRLSVD